MRVDAISNLAEVGPIRRFRLSVSYSACGQRYPPISCCARGRISHHGFTEGTNLRSVHHGHCGYEHVDRHDDHSNGGARSRRFEHPDIFGMHAGPGRSLCACAYPIYLHTASYDGISPKKSHSIDVFEEVYDVCVRSSGIQCAAKAHLRTRLVDRG